MSQSDVIVNSGKYNSKYLQTEPMIAWFTTTELGMMVWSSVDNLTIYPIFDRTHRPVSCSFIILCMLTNG